MENEMRTALQTYELVFIIGKVLYSKQEIARNVASCLGAGRRAWEALILAPHLWMLVKLRGPKNNDVTCDSARFLETISGRGSGQTHRRRHGHWSRFRFDRRLPGLCPCPAHPGGSK